jgi:ribosomal protein S18 acetylase RimI-like enzyme
MNIRRLGVGDDTAVAAAGHLFDRSVDADATARFFAVPNHHLLFAYNDVGRPVGFVSGVETTHPDKGTEMFLYELGVDEPARRQGIGRALVEALATIARERGCYGMFVLTDDDNVAALATYRSAGGGNSSPQVMLEWDLRDEASPNQARRGNSV